MRLRRTPLLVLAGIAALLPVPSSAAGAVLGSTHVSATSNSGVFCGGFPSCAFAQTALPAGTTRASFDGRIKSWNVNVSDPGSLQLLILRKRDDGSFQVVAGSTVRSPAASGVKSFGTNLKVREGDFVGLNMLDEDINIHTLESAGARIKGFNPAFGIAGRQLPYEPFSAGLTELQYNAKLKPLSAIARLRTLDSTLSSKAIKHLGA